MEQMDLLDLTKVFELNLEKADFPEIPIMDTMLAVDCSTSMREEFACKWVDRTIELFFAAAMKFDDDKKLGLGFFNYDFHGVPPLSSIPEAGVTKHYGVNAGGGTRYTPILTNMISPAMISPVRGFLSSLFGSGSSSANVKKSYLGIITDGDAPDFNEFERKIAEVRNTFIQIIVIGDQVTMGPIRNLEKMNDFVSVVHLPDPHSVTQDVFFSNLCNLKFKTWLENLPKE